MKVQITKQTGALCDESGRPLPAEIRDSPEGREAWDRLVYHKYGVSLDLNKIRAEIARRAARVVTQPSVVAQSGGAMLCAGCGDAVPCRQTPHGWMCDDCRRAR